MNDKIVLIMTSHNILSEYLTQRQKNELHSEEQNIKMASEKPNNLSESNEGTNRFS